MATRMTSSRLIGRVAELAELVELLRTRTFGKAAPARRLPRLRPHLRPRIAA